MWTKALILATTVLFGIVLTAEGRSKSISYKFIDDFSLIWNDRGSGANEDVAIWRPSPPSGYHLLGDVATSSYNMPTHGSLVVRGLQNDALARPVGFTEVWTDRGSGADNNVKIMKIVPPRGYVCLGDVAVGNYGGTPDYNLYRCVKKELAIQSGTYQLIWNDRGSGADRDVALWANSAAGSYVGISANTFKAFTHYGQPHDSPYLLNSQYAKREDKKNQDH